MLGLSVRFDPATGPARRPCTLIARRHANCHFRNIRTLGEEPARFWSARTYFTENCALQAKSAAIARLKAMWVSIAVGLACPHPTSTTCRRGYRLRTAHKKSTDNIAFAATGGETPWQAPDPKC